MLVKSSQPDNNLFLPVKPLIRPEKNNVLLTLKFEKSTFSGKKNLKYDKFEFATNCVNQIFNLIASFFFLLTGVAWYYYTIYLVFTYLALFLEYEDNIFEIISNLHIQGSKFGGKINKFGGKSKTKLNSPEFMGFVFSGSALGMQNTQGYHLPVSVPILKRKLFNKSLKICNIMFNFIKYNSL